MSVLAEKLLAKESGIVTAAKPAGYLPFIDGLRAVAVLGVICFHFNLAHITGGYVGVDVFFVLSGFLITRLIDAGMSGANFSFGHFYERRARRILPALIVICLLSAAAAAVLMVPHDLREFAKSLKGAAFFYSNVVFAQAAGYFADAISTRPLLHTWSLAVEEQFYLLFPPLLWAIRRLFSAATARWSALAGLALLSFAFSVWLLRTDVLDAFYLLPPRAWELLTGALIALAASRWTLPRRLANLLGLAGLGAIGVSFALFNRNTPFPGAAALLPCLGTALIIVANLGGKTLLGSVLSSRPLVYVGLISYGLYLYHWPILAFSRYYLDHELSPLQSLLALAATTLLAVLSYHYLETPIRTARWLSARRRVFTLAAGALVFLGVLGIAAVNADGFPARFSGAALRYAQANHDKWPWDRCMPAVEQLNAASVCKLGVSGRQPTFILWGDSHAAALAPAADARAKTLGVAGWVIGYSRCPALIGAAPLQRAADDHPCAAIAEKVLAFIREHHIHHVLLASRWDTYISGWERGGTETMQDLTVAYTASDGRQLRGLDAFRESLRETVRRLQALDVEVWIVKQVPPQLIDVPSALAKAVYLGRDPDSLRRPFEQIDLRRAAAESVFKDYQGRLDVFFIDPADKFCPDRSACLIAAQCHALYADGNHLSVFGALWSQAMLDPFFSSTIRSTSRP